MCGLAGVATTERSKNASSRRIAFSELLEIASLRGKDATGVGVVRAKDVKKSAIVYKKAVKAADFIELEAYRRLMAATRFEDYVYVLGHARSSTSDGWNMSDANAHPFQFGPITLTHNGTVRNYRMLETDNLDHPVDSAHVAAAMEKTSDPRKLLGSLFGPFALVWHDARDGSLNFAKNHDKPLYFCHMEGENTMYWGSELEAIYAILFRHGLKIDGKFKIATSGHWIKFDLKDLRKVEKIPFVEPQSRAAIQSTLPGERWKGETSRLPKSATTQTQEKSTLATKMDITSGSQGSTASTGVTETSNDVYTPNSLRPSSRKKIRAATERVESLGRTMDAPVCFRPTSWEPYKNQHNHGMIRGVDRVKGDKFQIGHVTVSIWNRALNASNIYGRIVNARKDRSGSGWVFICDYAPDLMERFVFKYSSGPAVPAATVPFPESKSKPQLPGGPVSVERVLEEIAAPREYEGPGGTKVTEKEFIVLVKHGCAFCSKDITPEDHEDILWVGPSLQSPICVICQGSRAVRDHLGIQDSAIERAE